jgi:predicted ester cyclase
MSDLVDRILALWTAPVDGHDARAAFRALYTDPVTVNGVDLSVDDLLTRARALHAAFSGLRAELLQVVSGDNSIAVAFVMHGQHTGPYAGPFGPVARTGVHVRIRTIDVLTLTGSRVSAIWVNADDLGLLRQLGVVPPGPA